MPERESLVLVGRITGAHGIRGAVKVHSFAESIALYQAGSQIILLPPNETDNFECKELLGVKPHGRGLLMHLASVNDRNQAEKVIGASIYIEKSSLPELEEDTYYWSDLLGMRVFDSLGAFLGRLDEVIPTKGNDVYVVKGLSGGKPRELLIPAVGKIVRSIDTQAQTMVVNLPEGL